MGPLTGVEVVEVAGIGPGPFCAMVLADMGADVVRVDRPSAVAGGDPDDPPKDVLTRGRRSVGIDLKHPDGTATLLRLTDRADVLVEGFRPGVAERLGFGPDVCRERNPRLVYGRMTGWGQDGPLASTAGHDIDYAAVAGALWFSGRAGEPPVPPSNLIADFGGGGMLLALGIAMALFERERSGEGQVIDAAMVDGAALLSTVMYGWRAMGMWSDARGSNFIDTGAPFYEVYPCADGGFLALGAIEPQFYDELITGLGLDPGDLPPQWDRAAWPGVKERFATVIAGRTRDEWMEVFAGTDACVAPVLSPAETPGHPHSAARGTFVDVAGVAQPAPAPRFSRTPGAIPSPPPHPGQHTDEVLATRGFSTDEVARLREAGAVR